MCFYSGQEQYAHSECWWYLGAQYLSSGLIKGAEKASELISYGTPKLISKIEPETSPRQVPSGVRAGVKVARDVTGTAVSVTGYVGKFVLCIPADYFLWSSIIVWMGNFIVMVWKCLVHLTKTHKILPNLYLVGSWKR